MLKTILIALGLASPAYAGTYNPQLLDNEQQYCMQQAIYFEAGNQPLVGKLAVGYVILNRVDSKDYPNTICDVVRQGPKRLVNDRLVPVKWRCQFTFYCDGSADTPVYNSYAWRESVKASHIIYLSDDYISQGATHYHATYVKPSWANHLTKIVTINEHIFYK